MGPTATSFPTVIALIRSYDSLGFIGFCSGSPCFLPTSRKVSPSYRALVCTFKTLMLLEFGLRDSVDRLVARKTQGLPGYWAVLFVRAMTDHLAGRVVPICPPVGDAPTAFRPYETLG